MCRASCGCAGPKILSYSLLWVCKPARSKVALFGLATKIRGAPEFPQEMFHVRDWLRVTPQLGYNSVQYATHPSAKFSPRGNSAFAFSQTRVLYLSFFQPFY